MWIKFKPYLSCLYFNEHPQGHKIFLSLPLFPSHQIFTDFFRPVAVFGSNSSRLCPHTWAPQYKESVSPERSSLHTRDTRGTRRVQAAPLQDMTCSPAGKCCQVRQMDTMKTMTLMYYTAEHRYGYSTVHLPFGKSILGKCEQGKQIK